MQDDTAKFIAHSILSKLSSGKSVLFFVTGGSGVDVGVKVSKILASEDLKGLTVTLTDERYGPVGHADSNWQQLLEKGFSLPGAKLIPVLTGDDANTTTQKFNQALAEELAKDSYKIGLFGIGADGHTAGILPGSDAIDSADLAYTYKTEKFERITITPKTIVALDEVVVYAKGEEKWKTLQELQTSKDIHHQPAQILKTVPLLTMFTDYKNMKIAIIGLGKMGEQIARKLHEGGFQVIAHNRSSAPVDEMKAMGMTGAYTKEEVVSAFGADPVVLWIMVPSDVVDTELDTWLTLVPKGSILIDGGNSDFRLTKTREMKVRESGSSYLDVGTSGGVWGYQNGFAMMAGGEKSAFEKIEPVLKTLALPSGAYHYFGESGAGHFVKMTHNAIEYGMMQSLAEGYRLLKEGPYKNIDLGQAGEVWQHHSVVTSWLNELCRDVLKENPELDGVEGFVAESGEARWALEVARELKIETPAIQTSFDVRLESQKGKINFSTKLLAAMRNAFGGHKINKDK